MKENPPNDGWVASLKVLLFGYDFFISYAQEEATRAYGDRLQAMLARRDYVIFRDTASLLLGDNLPLRIRWSLWRTRCLVVLGTERALTSAWVQKEVGIFAERGRPIVPLDLQAIRTRHPWKHIDEALFAPDSLNGPAPEVVDRITRSVRGWRANKLARLWLGATALAALAVAAVIVWQALNLRERALRMQAQSLVAIAQGLPDPVLRSLVFAEADVDRLPADAVRTAREIARSPMPETVLQASTESFSAIAVSFDRRWVFSVDDARIVRRWAMDGASDPVTLCTLPWRPERIEALRNAILCCDDSHAALVSIEKPGEPKVFEKPKDEDLDTDEAKKPETPRWVAADWSTAWRASADGRSVALCCDEQQVLVFVQSDDGTWKEAILPLPGRAALDVHLDDPAPDGRFTGFLVCTDGHVADFTCDQDRRLSLAWRSEPLVARDESLDFPDRIADARAIYAGGMRIVAGLASGRGLLMASRADKWTPRIFPAGPTRKLKS